MRCVSGKKFCKILEKKGWLCARITGSHHIFIKEGCMIRLTVPVHGNNDLKIGLQRSLMKMADITEDEL
ncbi:MAG: type II toxin-antitoxin system HicA family toxin [Chitinivibrionales bacterium]|nr:type II toxin-antitoxin system HicA family toxin [Chitinivibrionales bacterium]